MSWTNTKHTYKDTEGQMMSLEVTDEGAVILEAKEGVFFETEEDFLVFLEKLKEKSGSLFEEEV